MKTCTKCGETKPLDLFKARAACKDGRVGVCKACTNAMQRERRQTNPKPRKTYPVDESVVKRCRSCGAEGGFRLFNRDPAITDGLTNVCKACAASKAGAWYAANKARAEVTRKSYRHENREREREWTRHRYWADPEKARSKKLAAHHKSREALSEGFVKRMLRQQLRRSGVEPAETAIAPLVEAKREHLRLVRLLKEKAK